MRAITLILIRAIQISGSASGLAIGPLSPPSQLMHLGIEQTVTGVAVTDINGDGLDTHQL